MEAAALQAAIAAVRAAGFNVEGQADLERLRAPDQYEQELIVAAEVRAYFQIAYKVHLSQLVTPGMIVLTT